MLRLTSFLIFLFALTGCMHNNPLTSNATVLSYTAKECYCCPGWTILYKGEEIHSESQIIGQVVGYDDVMSIPVFIRLGDKDQQCSKHLSNKDHYQVTTIEIVD